jgi:hypothetical protein
MAIQIIDPLETINKSVSILDPLEKEKRRRRKTKTPNTIRKRLSWYVSI